MPTLDHCHQNVVHALEKEGWKVAPIPLRVEVEMRLIYVDIEAQRQRNGKRDQILLAEIKCFPDRNSTTTDLYQAIGQYLLYRATLFHAEIVAPLYLAIPYDVYHKVFDLPARTVCSESKIKLLIVNLQTETIVEWIE
jgi:hypothetical protein